MIREYAGKDGRSPRSRDQIASFGNFWRLPGGLPSQVWTSLALKC